MSRRAQKILPMSASTFASSEEGEGTLATLRREAWKLYYRYSLFTGVFVLVGVEVYVYNALFLLALLLALRGLLSLCGALLALL